MAVKYVDTLNPKLLEKLKSLGVTEDDLFNHYSDLYIGCTDIKQSLEILSGESRAIFSTFIPQEGSNMDKYGIAVEVVFGYIDGDFKEKHPNNHLRK